MLPIKFQARPRCRNSVRLSPRNIGTDGSCSIADDCIMPSIRIRIARAEDASEVSHVLLRSYDTLYRGWYRQDVLALALPQLTRANPTLLSSGRYFVGIADNQIVACGGWSGAPPTRGRDGPPHLRHFATDPRYLGRGFGGAIVVRSLDEARRVGFSLMEVISSLTAEAFYARHGFVPVAQVRQRMGGVDFDCVLMRRHLGT